mmetsp:Transcript_128804/g.400784  ORF Transcript_128804/g.400784 Transcript_128804/m.400784 type:complete len:137 (-) Transcript_128804:231-641(-)
MALPFSPTLTMARSGRSLSTSLIFSRLSSPLIFQACCTSGTEPSWGRSMTQPSLAATASRTCPRKSFRASAGLGLSGALGTAPPGTPEQEEEEEEAEADGAAEDEDEVEDKADGEGQAEAEAEVSGAEAVAYQAAA